MEETLEFCRRVLRSTGAAQEAARTAMDTAPPDRLQRLAAASRACRAHIALDVALPHAPGEDGGLDGAVARELAVATARLPERQREALALREAIGLSYADLAEVARIDVAAVGPLLARARLRLRAELRGSDLSERVPCAEGDRSLRSLARRQDGEPVAPEEHEWLSDHLGDCPPCRRMHAAMLEASVCYRARRVDAIPDADGLEPMLRDQRPWDARGEGLDREGDRPEGPKPALWSRFRSALAADARR